MLLGRVQRRSASQVSIRRAEWAVGEDEDPPTSWHKRSFHILNISKQIRYDAIKVLDNMTLKIYTIDRYGLSYPSTGLNQGLKEGGQQ
jgi:hypothetical protein